MKRSSTIGNPIDISPSLNPQITGYLLITTVAVEFLVVYLFGEYFDERPPRLFHLFIRVAIANVTTFAMGLAIRLWLPI